MPIHGVSGNTSTQNVVEQPDGWSDLGKNLAKCLGDIARKLFRTLGNQTPTQGRRIESAPNAAAPNAVATENVADPLTATNAAQKWLEAACVELQKALENTGSDINPQDALEQRTTNLLEFAKELKNEIRDNTKGLKEIWSKNLVADFDANIQLIQNHFNNATQTHASLAEINFLKAYFGYMKNCLSESHPVLSQELVKVEKALVSLKDELTNGTPEKESVVDDSSNNTSQANAVELNKDESAQPTTVAAAATASCSNEIQPADVVDLPSNSQESDGSNTESQQIADTNARLLAQNTMDLVYANQRAKAILLGAATASDANSAAQASDLVIDQLSREFHQARLLASVGKKFVREYADDSLHLKNQLAKLENDENDAPTASESLRNKPDKYKLQLDELVTKVNNLPIYDHALRSLGIEPENQQHQAIEQASYTVQEKKLALIILGSCAAQQSAAKGDNYGDMFTRTSLIIKNAAKLLADSLACKLPEQGQKSQITENFRHEIQVRINTMPDEEQKNVLNLRLNTLPANTLKSAYAKFFLNEVSLLVSESFKNVTSDAQSLIELAKTDRTFEKDRTAGINLKEGMSRQKILKESMIRAAALLSPTRTTAGEEALPAADTNRIGNATSNTLQNEYKEFIFARLGLSENKNVELLSEELLDQLTMAAVAQNDLSLKNDHQHRGSMQSKIKRYDNNSTVETLKNHNLNNFNQLNKKLITTAQWIRPKVDQAIRDTKNAINDNKRIESNDLQRLVKQIIITTDSKSALNPKFNLGELTEAANQLGAHDTSINRKKMIGALDNVLAAWRDEKAENDTTATPRNPAEDRWVTEDTRSLTHKVLTSNPVRSLPFLNRIPGVSKVSSAGFKLGKSLVATAGVPVVVTLISPFAIVGAIGMGIYKTHKAVNR